MNEPLGQTDDQALATLRGLDRGKQIARKIGVLQGQIRAAEDREFKTRDAYNRLVNEIRELAQKAAAWQELEFTPEQQIIDEINRIAKLYDPAE